MQGEENVESGEFDFDVAFSFHSLDEGLANDLNDRIQNTFKTFVYSKQQEKLAGFDGEEVFNSVFGARARCVVVLYRKEWGETPFTRIEQTAIRNRAFEKGFDFTLFIPTGSPPSVPAWLPKTRLWYGLERFGLDGAAAVIEARVQELGGEPRVESVLDRAARLQRSRNLDQAKRAFRESESGVKEARKAYASLIEGLGRTCEQIRNSNPGLSNLKCRRHHEYFIVTGLGLVMVLNWWGQYSNSLDGSELNVDLFDGVPRLPSLMSFADKPNHLHSCKFEYVLFGKDRYGYIEVGGPPRELTVDQLKDYLLRLYMDRSEVHRKTRT